MDLEPAKFRKQVKKVSTTSV